MMHGGNGDGCRIELQIGGQQFIHSGKNGNSVPGRGLSGARRVRLDGCHQSNALPGHFQFAVDAQVIFAKGAVSGDGKAQNGLAGYCAAPSPGLPSSGPWPSTACRQRL